MDYKDLVHAYWTEFQSVRFHVILDHTACTYYLVLPKIFIKHVKGKLPEMATLVTKRSKWDVKLEVDGDSGALLLTDGWREFVDTHILKENDIVIFKHVGRFQFKVSMFDSKTGGQNPTGFFFRKRGRDVGETENQETEGKAKHSLLQQKDNHSNPDGNIQPARKKTRSQDCDDKKRQVARGDLDQTGKKDDQVEVAAGMEETDRNLRYPEAHGDNGEPDGKSVARSLKNQTLQKAEDLKKDGDIVVYMNATCTEKARFVAVTPKWARGHELTQSQGVELHCGEGTWPARFYVAQKNRTTAGFSTGWKQFAKDTDLKVGDACIFSVLPPSVRGAGGCVCIGVTIVRK